MPDSSARAIAIARAEGCINLLRNGRLKSVEDVRMVEAQAAASYFRAWKSISLKWRSLWKHPIPDNWLTIGSRGTLSRAKLATNRNARHPVNAMLNYAYGVLYSKGHIDALVRGFDPRRGIMHHDRDDGDALAMVFDLVEPSRPTVDAAVLKFIQIEPLRPADFVVNSSGVCRLVPGLARAIAAVATNACD